MKSRPGPPSAGLNTDLKCRLATRAVPPGSPVSLDHDGRAVVLEFTMGIGPQLVEGVDQISQRAFTHSGVAVEAIAPVAQSTKSGQKPNAGTAVFQPQLGASAGGVPAQPSISTVAPAG